MQQQAKIEKQQVQQLGLQPEIIIDMNNIVNVVHENIQLSKQELYNEGIPSQKDYQLQTEKQNIRNTKQNEQSNQIQQINSNFNSPNQLISLEQSIGISTSRSSNYYIQNYDTAGICEQNFCFCFTHTVDIVTLLLVLFIGRTDHRRVFLCRIFISLIFDMVIPPLFAQFYNSLRWELIASQMAVSFILLISSSIAAFQYETPKYAKFSLALNLPFVSIFKVILRCSNNLFCREDQVNTNVYLSHRPLMSLHLANVAKSAILSSSLISFLTLFGLTFHNIKILQESHLALYIILIALYFLDVIRNAYQAIVAENNHRKRATAYADVFEKNYTNDQDVSVNNFDQPSEKQQIDKLVVQQQYDKQSKKVGDNIQQNKVSSLSVCIDKRQDHLIVKSYSNKNYSGQQQMNGVEFKKQIFNQQNNQENKEIDEREYQEKQKQNGLIEEDQMLESVELNMEGNYVKKEKIVQSNSELNDPIEHKNSKCPLQEKKNLQLKEENVRQDMQLFRQSLSDNRFIFDKKGSQTKLDQSINLQPIFNQQILQSTDIHSLCDPLSQEQLKPNQVYDNSKKKFHIKEEDKYQTQGFVSFQNNQPKEDQQNIIQRSYSIDTGVKQHIFEQNKQQVVNAKH